jgi:hypothetical protein
MDLNWEADWDLRQRLLRLRMIGVEGCLIFLKLSTKQERWYVEVFCSLLQALVVSYKDLESGFSEKRLTRTAWAARCLFELNVWARWVILSEHNAKRFRGDTVVDANHLFTQFIAMLEKYNVPPFDPVREKLEQLSGQIEKQKQEVGLAETDKFLKPSKCAEELGIQEFYPMNSFLSKFVHVTGLSLFAGSSANEETLCKVMLIIGVGYCNDAVDRIGAKLQELGLPSPPKNLMLIEKTGWLEPSGETVLAKYSRVPKPSAKIDD